MLIQVQIQRMFKVRAGLNKSMIALYVPMSAIDAYKANANWKEFNIIGMNE